MNRVRLIKKFSNRRLYDTVEGRYITLTDVAALIRDRTLVLVRDREGDDITRATLLHVLLEQEESLDAVLTKEFLTTLITCSAVPQRGALATHLEECLRNFFDRPGFDAPGDAARSDPAE